MANYDYRFKKETAFQREMLANEQQFTERMWNQTNDWNSPASQMQRMMDAGINPNNAAEAISGGSSASMPASPSTPGAPDPAGSDAANLISSIGNLGNTVMGIAQYLDTGRRNTEADTEKIKAETGKTYADTGKIREETNGLVFQNRELLPKQKEELQSIIDKNIADKQYTDNESARVKELTNQVMEQTRTIVAERAKIDEEINLLQEQIKTEQTVQGRNAAEKQLAEMNARKSQLDGDYQAAINNYESELQSIGTSTQASGNTVINEQDRLGILNSRNNKVTDKLNSDYNDSKQRATNAAHKIADNLYRKRTSGNHVNPRSVNYR